MGTSVGTQYDLSDYANTAQNHDGVPVQRVANTNDCYVRTHRRNVHVQYDLSGPSEHKDHPNIQSCGY